MGVLSKAAFRRIRRPAIDMLVATKPLSLRFSLSSNGSQNLMDVGEEPIVAPRYIKGSFPCLQFKIEVHLLSLASEAQKQKI